MKKILKVHQVNDYARYIGAAVLHPLVSVIHYDELEHCRHPRQDCRPGEQSHGMKPKCHNASKEVTRWATLLVLAIMALSSCRAKQQVVATATRNIPTPVEHGHVQEHSPSVLLVMYDAEVGKQPLLEAIKDYGCEIVYDYHMINGMALKKPDDKTLDETMQHFRRIKGVLTVDYDYIYHLTDPVKPKLEVR